MSSGLPEGATPCRMARTQSSTRYCATALPGPVVRFAPAWMLLLLDVMVAAPSVVALIESYPLADPRIGLRQKKFRVPSEAAALDAITGICSNAMRRVALGRAPANHDVDCASLVLRALGVPSEEAAAAAVERARAGGERGGAAQRRPRRESSRHDGREGAKHDEVGRLSRACRTKDAQYRRSSAESDLLSPESDHIIS